MPASFDEKKSSLNDIKIFFQDYIKYGAISKKVGDYKLDLAPDKMYYEIKNNNGIYVFG